MAIHMRWGRGVQHAAMSGAGMMCLEPWSSL